ncbi:MAG: DNA-processing protein DprA [Acidobacteriota bacterium]
MNSTALEFSRETLIAFASLPFLTPARTAKLLGAFPRQTALSLVSGERLATVLNITAEQAELVRNSLQCPPCGKNARQGCDRVVTLVDEAYPALLREIADPPPALFYHGDPGLLDTPSVAVVGSRRASAYGLNAAARLSRELASAGVTIVSGLARGIDAAAHLAALNAGAKTVAVLGTGIDVSYPRSNRSIFERISESGLLVTEFPHGTPPRAMNFPVRNRIISGLALGTVIVEANGRSGSLITARMAAEQGREVFAVPGSIFNTGCEGTHRLIQYGAKLVHDVDDIFDELPQIRPAISRKRHESKPDPLACLIPRDEPIGLDMLAMKTGREVSELAGDLLRLEMDGAIRQVGGGRYVRHEE